MFLKKYQDRTHYGRLPTTMLLGMVAGAKDRQTRADTPEAALIDGYQIREIGVVLAELGGDIRGDLIPAGTSGRYVLKRDGSTWLIHESHRQSFVLSSHATEASARGQVRIFEAANKRRARNPQ